jgi:transcriptional antiterminator RfaH
LRTVGGENRIDPISLGERLGRAGHDDSVSHRPTPPADDPFRLIEGERWYVVHTQPHRESRAQAHLAAQGFRAFLPRHRKTVRHARRLKTVSAPLFPCYLFVVLDLGRDRWRSVNGTFGVLRLVSGEESPIPVPAGVVESMVAKCGADGHLNLGRSLEVGDRVRVLSGPFADLIGELTRIDGAARVRVLLRLLGSEIPVSIGHDALVRTFAA